ncbi:MAG: hypothetical protein WC997_12970 [Porticoccaceae bacterium]
MSDLLGYLKSNAHAGFDVVDKKVDYLLSVEKTPEGMENETFLWSFQIPEKNLIGIVYLWVHSALRTTSAGVVIWQGVNRYPQEIEHFNYIQHLPYPESRGDTIFVPGVNLKIKIVEPLVSHVIEYSHAPTDTSLFLTTKALHSPVQENGKLHYEQAMHMKGEMKLNGESCSVDCYSMRDHGYRGARSEAMTLHPPVSYASGVSDDGSVIFNFGCSDNPSSNPPWSDHYSHSNDDTFLQGWICRDNQLCKITEIDKSATYDKSDFYREVSWKCLMVDEFGEKHVINAQRRAAVPWCPWMSTFNDFLLFSFEMDDGITGYGWYNQAYWNDYGRLIKSMV